MSESVTFKPHVQALLDKTKQYWDVSRAYNRQGDAVPTTGHALTMLSSVINNSDPGRPLNKQAGALQYNIICGGARDAKVG